MTYFDQVLESTRYISERVVHNPDIAIVLGSGLSTLIDHVEIIERIPYEEIPHFPPATVKGHDGAIILGSIAGKSIIAQAGRYHYYEGYDMKEVTLPIRVFKFLKAKSLLIASAVGGIHEDYQAGDVTVVNDHINLHHQNPLHGPNDPRLGERFPDMVDAYSPRLRNLAHEVAKEKGIVLHDSIYAGLPGPNLETKAEYNYLHLIGATVVGMSTVPEIIVAKHMDLEACVLTAVTNKCYPISAIKKVTHDEVLSVAKMTEAKISSIVIEMIKRM